MPNLLGLCKYYSLIIIFNSLQMNTLFIDVSIKTPDGDKGNGKSTCLSHVIHACGKNNWLIVSLPFGY